MAAQPVTNWIAECEEALRHIGMSAAESDDLLLTDPHWLALLPPKDADCDRPPLMDLLRQAGQLNSLADLYAVTVCMRADRARYQWLWRLIGTPSSIIGYHLRPAMRRVAVVRLYHAVLRARLERLPAFGGSYLPLELWIEVAKWL